MKISFKILTIITISLFLSSCSKKSTSPTTGWNYNETKSGGFEVNTKFTEQMTGPGLMFIEGGTFSMGRVEQDVMYEWNNVPRRVTVSSFYLDETEVSNTDYLEYLYWLKRVYGQSYPEVYTKALPDTLVWRDKLGYNEPYVTQYLRHPAYRNYPVVGVSWSQANNYCNWRTDRVNERILINEGILKEDIEQVDDNTFNTEAYLAGQYEGIVKKNPRNYDPSTGEKSRRIKMKDGLLLPKY
ncbi:SUMF1/EgtB/PvdO family nonheme iron enzyme, partial [Bacteroidota bacterium]|nr:SUMF1/EgtB/PvdO family nonheme iron enzyme [Bacteroidota bacterium]